MNLSDYCILLRVKTPYINERKKEKREEEKKVFSIRCLHLIETMNYP